VRLGGFRRVVLFDQRVRASPTGARVRRGACLLDAHRERDDGDDLGASLGLVDPPPSARPARDGWRYLPVELRVAGMPEPPVNDRRVESFARAASTLWAVCAVVERHGMEFDPIRGVPGRVRPVEEANAVDRRGAGQFLEWLVG
jgi:hypothetical protein